MPRIGPLEIFLILVVVLIVFGIGKLPQVGKGMGQAIREFRSNVKDGEDKAIAEESKTETEVEVDSR